MLAPKTTTKPKELCLPGLYLCRLVQVIDLGTQRFQGRDPSRRIYFGFETLELGKVFKEEKGEEPYMLQAEFAFFMVSSGDKKTKLRQFVESWFNKSFPSDEEAAAFDFSVLLGRLAGVMVAHLPKKDGGMKACIVGICPPDKEKAKLKWPDHNPLICYEINHREGGDFGKLPAFLQNKLRESDEFKQRIEEPEPTYGETVSEDYAPATIEDDDIPFN